MTAWEETKVKISQDLYVENPCRGYDDVAD